MSTLRSRVVSLAALLALAFILALGWLSWTDSIAAQQAEKKQPANSGLVERPGPTIAAADLPIMKALDSTMKVDFKGQPMKEVLEAIGARTNGKLNLIVDEFGIRQAGVDPDLFLNDPVTMSFHQPLKVRFVLKQLLLGSARGMDYYVEDGVLYVTKDAKAQGKWIVKAYPVSNLVGGQQLINAAVEELKCVRTEVPPGFILSWKWRWFPEFPDQVEMGQLGELLSQNVDGLTALVMGTVAPDSWKLSGSAPGTIIFVHQTSSLQIRASREVHNLIIASDVLNNNRKNPIGDAEASISPQDLTVIKSLDSTEKIDFRGLPMKDVLEYLNERKLNITVDELGMKAAAPPVDPDLFLNDPVTLKHKQPLKFRVALKMLLEPRGMDYYIDDGMLVVTKDQKARKAMVVKAYPVSNLIGGPELVREALAELQFHKGKMGPTGLMLNKNILSLTAHVMSNVEPNYWKENGDGPGSMAFYPEAQALLIRASVEVHGLLIASGLLDNNRKVKVNSVAGQELKAVTVRSYNVAGLIDPKNSESSKAELLGALKLVAVNGKDKEPSSSAVILAHSGLLVVRETMEAHQRIEQLLEQMRAVRSVPGMNCPAGVVGRVFFGNTGGGLFGNKDMFGGSSPPPTKNDGGGFLGDVK